MIVSVSAGIAAQSGATMPLRVAVYDVEPYGGKGRDGLFDGASVDLWRRVAEDRHWQYQLTLVARLDDLLSGLEAHTYDVGIGAITITPERMARVDFSYPTHRSGVAAVFARKTGAASAFHDYVMAAGELGELIGAILVLLAVIGVLMWWFERPHLSKDGTTETASSVTSWHEGMYWAVVTMTTVGYGDKTPKTHLGRGLAVLWMVGSLVLVSLLTTSLIARMTVSRVEGIVANRTSDLSGKRLGAVSGSSGAEYLDTQRLAYQKYETLADTFEAVASGKADAVVNSIGALQYLTRTRFADTIAPPHGVLAPAYMAFALPMNSDLKRPLDRALTIVTASPEWRSVEDTYFGQ
ncbi:transporter substrate-binding domain-containing protein [Bradyrhizobium mercantei]|uniref:transporter substrate-binding domain-containing protein n=1 Tax=Bradyrhizobium mercantei TaxID=1904807 RepID=UPI00135655F6|nr:transporter substrate-binding domain-containing protein [Bradyrhizobium mercantei]